MLLPLPEAPVGQQPCGAGERPKPDSPERLNVLCCCSGGARSRLDCDSGGGPRTGSSSNLMDALFAAGWKHGGQVRRTTGPMFRAGRLTESAGRVLLQRNCAPAG